MDINIAEIVKGTIASITLRFADLSDAQLRELREVEAQGQKRAGLFDAIDAELKGRADSAAERSGIHHSGSDDGKINISDEARALVDDAAKSEPMVSQTEVNRLLAERDAAHALEIATMHRNYETRIADAAAAKSVDPAPLPKGKSEFATLALTQGAAIAFVDDQHHEVKGLPELTFMASDFRPSDNMIVLTKDIELPTSLTDVTIAGAVLLADDDDDVSDAIAVAMLVQPVGAGGGRSVKLPGGTLAFSTR